MQWKIAEFGLTSEATSNRLVTSPYARGKPCYRAPELLSESKPCYNNKLDMFSLGCILYELVTGEKAFSTDFAVFQYASSHVPPQSLVTSLDQDTSGLLWPFYVYDLLDIDPDRRP